MGAQRFGKAERLNSKKSIQELFTRGSYFYSHPFKVLVVYSSDAAANQVLISVSKRSFKKAVDRNTLKRRTREGYRLQKEQLTVEGNVRIGLLYTAKTILSSSEIHKGVLAALKKISKQPLPVPAKLNP